MDSLVIGIYAIIISFVIGLILCPLLIPVLHRMKFGQTERAEGPESHLKKTGTPTMGGIAILTACTLTCVIFARYSVQQSWDGIAVLLVTLGFGIIGFLDDYIKVVKKRSLGLTPLQKIVGQVVIMALFYFYIRSSALGSEILIPFTNGRTLDLGILYLPFLFFVILGTVNGVNLTDGLDGLAGGITLIVAMFFMMVNWAFHSAILTVSAAVIGSLLSFLIFNAYPARVFMGDTGSLALGGYVAATAVLLRMPIFIVLVGFIYFVESISVILQVGYFKRTGKRIFKMAPIHHHFELCGWSETKVVTVFYIITALCCLVAFLGCKNFIL